MAIHRGGYFPTRHSIDITKMVEVFRDFPVMTECRGNFVLVVGSNTQKNEEDAGNDRGKRVCTHGISLRMAWVQFGLMRV